MEISYGGYMEWRQLPGSTTLAFVVGDELGTWLVVRANVPIEHCRFPDANLTWLLPACAVPCGIVIFRWHYHGCQSALQMLLAQLQVQTDPFVAWWLPELSIWLCCSWNLTNDARRKIVHTQFHDVAGSRTLLVSIIKPTNKRNKDNDVPKVLFGTWQ